MTEAKGSSGSGARRLLGLRRGSGGNGGQEPAASAVLPQPPTTAVRRQQPHGYSTKDELDVAVHLPPASPGVPPRKTWEQQYRNFLNRNAHNSKSSPNAVVSSGAPPALPLTSGEDSQPPPARPTANDTTTGKLEGSVRGGKLFGGMFRSHSNNKNNNTTTADTSGTLTPPLRRRVKSLSNDLDGTRRKGSPKATPPPTTHVRTVSASALSQLPGVAVVGTNGSSGAPYLQPRMANQQQQQQQQPPPLYFMPRVRTTTTTSTKEDNDADDQDLAPEEDAAHEAFDKMKQRSIVQRESGTTGEGEVLAAELPQNSDSANPVRNPSSLKKAFTEFHHAADSDAWAAYLGGEDDDSSYRSGLQVGAVATTGMVQRVSSATNKNPLGTLRSTTSLPKVIEGQPSPSEDNNNSSNTRILRPILSTDEWQTGRRYLIGPAALAACPGVVKRWRQEAVNVEHATDEASRFGTICLGKCHLSYGTTSFQNGDIAATAATTTTSTTDMLESRRWSSAVLMLRQNYLLEFDAPSSAAAAEGDERVHTQPRGYAHLQHAAAFPHGRFADMLELHFYGSPCAKTDKRILWIRVEDASQIDTWMARLNRAASLTIEDIYSIEPGMLGKGQYSTVHKATRRVDNHGIVPPRNNTNRVSPDGTTESAAEEVAVKLFDKNQFWRLVVKGVERADTLVRECSTQATLTNRHPNLYPFIHLRGFLETADHIILEMEYLDGTDLFHHITRRGVLPEPEAACILSDLLQLIVAMNEVGLSHRDIKPANILICQNQQGLASLPSSSAGIKLCDFGMAAFAGKDGLVRGRCGTPGYVAPEIFTAGRHGGYGQKVDVFSTGVTLYVMLCGYEPFYGTSDEELIEANRTAELEFPPEEWSSVSKEAISLVQAMMAVDPDNRPSAQDVLANPWVQKHATTTLTSAEASSSVDSDETADVCVIL